VDKSRERVSGGSRPGHRKDVLAVAISLLLVDGVATGWLVARRRRVRRVRCAPVVRPTSAPNYAAAVRANEDLARRQALLQAHRFGALARGGPPAGTLGPMQGAASGAVADLREAADLLAATPQLLYDPATWER